MTPQHPSTQFLRTRGFSVVFVLVVGLMLYSLHLAPQEMGVFGVFLLLGGAAALLSLVVHPLACFSLYFAALFFADTQIPGMPVTANQLLAVLFFMSVGSYWFRGHAMKLESSLLALLLVIAVYFSISAGLGESTERGLVHMRYVIIYWVMAMSLAMVLKTEKTILMFAWVVVVLTFAAAMVGLVQAVLNNLSTVLGGSFYKMRIQGTAKNPIVFAWNILFAFPFAFYLYSEVRSRAWGVVAIMLGSVSLMVAVLTFNRQTYFMLLAMVALAAVLFRYRNRVAVLGTVLVVGGAAVVAVFPIIVARLFTLTQLSRDPSFLDRRDASIVAWAMFKQHPFFGVGLGSYPAVWREYLPEDYPTFAMQYQEATRLRYPDMGYMAVLSETGLVGLVLFVTLIGFITYRAWMLRREAVHRDDNFVANLCTLVLCLVALVAMSSAIQDTFLYVRVWVMIGLAILLDRRMLWGGDAEDVA